MPDDRHDTDADSDRTRRGWRRGVGRGSRLAGHAAGADGDRSAGLDHRRGAGVAHRRAGLDQRQVEAGPPGRRASPCGDRWPGPTRPLGLGRGGPLRLGRGCPGVAAAGAHVLRGDRSGGRGDRMGTDGRRPGGARGGRHLDLREVVHRAQGARATPGTWEGQCTASCSWSACRIRWPPDPGTRSWPWPPCRRTGSGQPWGSPRRAEDRHHGVP